jgi:hypothetical protein
MQQSSNTVAKMLIINKFFNILLIFGLVHHMDAGVLYINGILRHRSFIYGGQGRVDAAINTVNVSTVYECMSACNKNRTCSFFSITPNGSAWQCRVTAGNTTWTPDQSSQLFLGILYTFTCMSYVPYNHDNPKNPYPTTFFSNNHLLHVSEHDNTVFQAESGYTLQTDGKLYKTYAYRNMSTLEATRLCWADLATVAVPYPSSVYDIILGLLPAGDLKWPAGAIRWTSNNFASGMWVTFDGEIQQ